ncbi:MAG: 5'-nucleotidase, partial [Xanthomonadales bacterium]|nr:5'-nucleotidase [Xanthomonadales bacterium]
MAESSIQKTNPQLRDYTKPLVVAISSRALFDLDESHKVFESKGLEAYAQYQIDRENE